MESHIMFPDGETKPQKDPYFILTYKFNIILIRIPEICGEILWSEELF